MAQWFKVEAARRREFGTDGEYLDFKCSDT